MRGLMMIAVAAAPLLAVGCGGDRDPSGSDADTDTDTDADTDADTDTDTDADTDTDTDTDSDSDSGDGACDNPADLATIDAEDVDGAAITCGMSCMSDSDVAGCVSTCLQGDPGLSPECADCYGARLVCAATYCASECLMNPASAACLACQETNGCASAFETCSGLELEVDTDSDSETDSETDSDPVDACDNTADLAIIGSVDVETAAINCGMTCIAEPDLSACTADCLQSSPGLSADCSECYGDLVECAVTNCFSECTADPTSIACTSCQDTAGCTATFDACSGL